MRVFLDTNILLDIIEGRQQFLLASSNVNHFDKQELRKLAFYAERRSARTKFNR